MLVGHTAQVWASSYAALTPSEGEPMSNRVLVLTEAERSFLQKVIDLGGQLAIGGNYDHRQLDQIVADKLVTRQCASIDTVVYAISDKGRSALTKQTSPRQLS
jgi:hypothetical protein